MPFKAQLGCLDGSARVFLCFAIVGRIWLKRCLVTAFGVEIVRICCRWTESELECASSTRNLLLGVITENGSSNIL
jgi:hypothetical protein